MSINNIRLEDLKTNPNIAVEVSREIESASWENSPFEALVGRGGDRGIRTYKTKDISPYRPRLNVPLTGDGVEGNADLATNYDSLEILSQTVYPRVVGNAIRSDIKDYLELNHIDFQKLAISELTLWMKKRRDSMFCAALLNDLSNAVVSDKEKGYKSEITTTTTTNSSGTSAASSKKAKSVQELAKEVKKGDVMSVKALRRAIFMARTGIKYNGEKAFPIKPIKSDLVTYKGLEIRHNSYIILLDSYQIEQLKADSEWQSMQKQLTSAVGEKSGLFTGLVGMIDNCPVIDMNVFSELQCGLMNSETPDKAFYANINPLNFEKKTPPSDYANSQPTSIGFLIGASALVMVGDPAVKFYINETEDAGRKMVVGVDKLLAISKGRFFTANGESSPYNNTDYAVIGLISSKE